MKADCEQEVYLGLGTNTGEREAYLKQAIEKLTLVLGKPLSVSDIIETEPWGFQSKNRFLNLAACFKTTLSAEELLCITEDIEREMGRTEKSIDGNYHDRTIDIDILLYADKNINTPRLEIPHPLMHKRKFVLIPLAQIAPQLIHPTLRQTMKELLDTIADN